MFPTFIKFARLALAVSLLASGFAVLAQETQQTKPGADLSRVPPRQGWFFYEDPAEKEKSKKDLEPVKQEVRKPVPKDTGPTVVIASGAVKTKAEKCADPATWDGKCGFIDPGDNFEFQAKQRDILLQQMSMSPQDPDAVEGAQRYMKWVVGKASMAANMWYFNMVQKPDLDPTVTNPISEVGIALASKIKDASQLEYFRLIREEGGVLFYFTRNDCSFCHDQAPFTRRVAQTMGLQLINIPLDGICIEGFEGDNCGDNITQEQVQPLNVAMVPTIYLYVPSNTWIRLGTGITSDSTILANTVNFFSAYRAAMLQGLTNGDGVRPSVSFDPNVRGEPTGVVKADGAPAPGTPDRSKLLEMMGYPGAKK